MDHTIKIEKKYLGIPIYAEQPEKMLEIFLGEEKIFEFQVPVCVDVGKDSWDYISYLNVEQYKEETLTIRGNFDIKILDSFRQQDDYQYEPLCRPLIHFTAQRGWINDPNGFLYHNGWYHLYFQHNPMNTQWQNMSWGHAKSRDLLTFIQGDHVLFPDETGPAFSGCGLVNERGLLGLPGDTLLFYYSAAGGGSPWSEGRLFTQRIAVSRDEGESLEKLPGVTIGEMEKDTRDPKIFWHEETKAYVMVLWIQGNEFAFFRSENLKDWEETDRIVLDEAWECPDLFCLEYEGKPMWVFTSADGFYYLGDFDGYTFCTDKVRRLAYQTPLPYAAQTCSGAEGRVVSIAWLRTKNPGQLYTGMMSIPRELTLVKQGEGPCLSLLPVREYEESKKKMADFSLGEEGFSMETEQEGVTEISLELEGSGSVEVQFFGQKLTVKEGELTFGDQRTRLPETLKELHVIVDRYVVEVHGNKGTFNAFYETESPFLKGNMKVTGPVGRGQVFLWTAGRD
ncbi:MAG: glycoside hydrolase family 32 protein [Eubacteriales bacterium]|nr:glycoside hydrolase family 32 protein [Eubacteriales bacterium]